VRNAITIMLELKLVRIRKSFGKFVGIR